jgi:hypothetical protein
MFGADIDPDQLWFSRRDDDLDVDLVGGGGRLTVRGWYADSRARLAEFRTARGDVLVESRVQQLVDAMAAFGPPSGSDLHLIGDVRDDLEPVLAASWQPPAAGG